MTQDKKIKYRIAVRSESNHPIEAHSADEAIQQWQDELLVKRLPYKIIAQEWNKGYFRIVVELQTHLSQEDQESLSENISIDNVSKSGETIK